MGKPQISGNLDKLHSALQQARNANIPRHTLEWHLSVDAEIALILEHEMTHLYSMTINVRSAIGSIYGIPSVPDDTLGAHIVELRSDGFTATVELEPIPRGYTTVGWK